MAGVRQVNSRQRANKAQELQALCTWFRTFSILGVQSPLFEATRKRAEELVEELTNTKTRVACPLFPKLEGAVGIRLYELSADGLRFKRRLLRKNLTPLATKAGIEHLEGENRKYYVEAFSKDGRILRGRPL